MNSYDGVLLIFVGQLVLALLYFLYVYRSERNDKKRAAAAA